MEQLNHCLCCRWNQPGGDGCAQSWMQAGRQWQLHEAEEVSEIFFVFVLLSGWWFESVASNMADKQCFIHLQKLLSSKHLWCDLLTLRISWWYRYSNRIPGRCIATVQSEANGTFSVWLVVSHLRPFKPVKDISVCQNGIFPLFRQAFALAIWAFGCDRPQTVQMVMFEQGTHWSWSDCADSSAHWCVDGSWQMSLRRVSCPKTNVELFVQLLFTSDWSQVTILMLSDAYFS